MSAVRSSRSPLLIRPRLGQDGPCTQPPLAPPYPPWAPRRLGTDGRTNQRTPRPGVRCQPASAFRESPHYSACAPDVQKVRAWRRRLARARSARVDCISVSGGRSEVRNCEGADVRGSGTGCGEPASPVFHPGLRDLGYLSCDGRAGVRSRRRCVLVLVLCRTTSYWRSAECEGERVPRSGVRVARHTLRCARGPRLDVSIQVWGAEMSA